MDLLKKASSQHQFKFFSDKNIQSSLLGVENQELKDQIQEMLVKEENLFLDTFIDNNWADRKSPDFFIGMLNWFGPEIGITLLTRCTEIEKKELLKNIEVLDKLTEYLNKKTLEPRKLNNLITADVQDYLSKRATDENNPHFPIPFIDFSNALGWYD